jgi:hypothetical protein
MTDTHFALLKLEKEQDTNFSFGCVVANFNPNSNYIHLTPVDCECKIANAFLCAMDYTECQDKIKVSEQLDLQFDPIFQEEQANYIQQKQNYIANIFTQLKISQSFQNMFSILWHAKTPCFDLGNSNLEKTFLKDCKWKGQTVPCSAIFSQFPTDKGMCCSFNMKAAEEIFHKETYVQLVNSLQNVNTMQKLDVKETNPGKNKGLTVVIGKTRLKPEALLFYYNYHFFN